MTTPDTRATDREERNFRWAYLLLIMFAIQLLEEANAHLPSPNTWPAGQKWNELSNSSRSIFLHRAREAAGIPHDEFLEGIRSGRYDVDDLYGADEPNTTAAREDT